MDPTYLKELEQVLQAEAELLRQGTDLLADPEYRALRELFVDGELTIAQFAERVENLAETRPEQDAQGTGAYLGPDDVDPDDDPEADADADADAD
ncbi:MAG: hypothetical protein AB7P21_10750 [Lautropia sp.]